MMKENLYFYKQNEKFDDNLEVNYINSPSLNLDYEISDSKEDNYDDILFTNENIKALEDYKVFDHLSINKNCNVNTIYSFEEKISNEDLYIKDETLNKIYFNKKENSIELYTIDKIKKEIFPKLNISEDIKEKIIPTKNITNIEKSMSITKIKRKKTGKIKFNINTYEKLGDIEERKLGRKKADTEYSKSFHNIYSSDNIIIKIKVYLFEYALIFINTILNLFLGEKKLKNYKKIFLKNRKKDFLIKNIDYKFIRNIKKVQELSLLSTSLKDIFSNNISPKYKAYPPDINKQIINRIIKENSNNKIIIKVFNLTFREWIDIFTYKKDLNTIIKFDEETSINIDEKFDHIDKIILDIYNKYQETNYLVYFISYIYNYERWFIVKKSRNRK